MKVVALVSGGLDSAVMLYHLLDQGMEVRGILVDYGQKNYIELAYAENLCKVVGIKLDKVLVQAPTVFQGCSLTDEGIGLGKGHDKCDLTTVPNRNMILLSFGIGAALSKDYEAVAYGAHKGYRYTYADCKEGFVAALNTVANFMSVKIMCPFLNMGKAEIISLGYTLGVPLSETYSCFAGGVFHCGECDTCSSRRAGFKLSNIEDPTTYERS